MKRAVINVAIGKWFPKGQDRLGSSLLLHSPDIDTLFWTNVLPDGSPSHSDKPYAFKMFAIQEAIRLGYDSIIWIDASIFAIKDVTPIFEYIEKNDYIFFANSILGLFSSDNCLSHFNITRESAMGMTELMGCCFGLNLKSKKCLEFVEECTNHAMDGICFPGDWKNDRLQVSADPKVFGHRHDQTVMTILAHKMGMNNFLLGHNTFFTYKDQISIYNPNGLPESIALLSEGM
jgi:hypothetical protein